MKTITILIKLARNYVKASYRLATFTNRHTGECRIAKVTRRRTSWVYHKGPVCLDDWRFEEWL